MIKGFRIIQITDKDGAVHMCDGAVHMCEIIYYLFKCISAQGYYKPKLLQAVFLTIKVAILKKIQI